MAKNLTPQERKGKIPVGRRANRSLHAVRIKGAPQKHNWRPDEKKGARNLNKSSHANLPVLKKEISPKNSLALWEKPTSGKK